MYSVYDLDEMEVRCKLSFISTCFPDTDLVQ